VLLAELEQADGADQVMIQQLVGTGRTLDSGQHAGIGRCIEHPINGGDFGEVFRIADIPLNQSDSLGL
jgi:hypothetical protein